MSLTKLCTIAVSLVASFSPVFAKDVDLKASTKVSAPSATKAKASLKKATSKASTATKTTSSKLKDQGKKAVTKVSGTKAKASSAISAPGKKTLEEMKKSAKTLSASQNKAMLQTLNSGSTSDLTVLPGIGAKTAVSIKTARPFKDVTDLGNIKGIGAKKFSGVVKHFKK